MDQITVGMRVVRLDDKGVPTPLLGTVKDMLDTMSVSLVEWDSGELSMCHNTYLASHQGLKRMFKHGPKLAKRA